MFFTDKEFPWWTKVLWGVFLIVITSLIVFSGQIHTMAVEGLHGYKNKLATLLFNFFINYGGRWIVLAFAIYYGISDIREGIKMYRSKKQA